MKLKYSIPIVLLIFVLVISFLFLNQEKEYLDDENTLYAIKFDNLKIRFKRYDYALGQNQLVIVEKSIDNGKTYERITNEFITVSMNPKFVFLSAELGFVITKPNLTKENNYIGIKVTQDGGKTFIDGKINYENSAIEILTVEEIPYYEKGVLKLHCSIYQVKEDHTGYEDIDLFFTSIDRGLTWNLE